MVKQNVIKKMKILFILLITLLLATSCNNGVSTSGLTEEVRNDINESFKSQAKSEGINYQIKDLILVHKGGNEYDGILKTIEDGEEFSYEVVVNVDEEGFIWKINN